jgi:hypothetical protein
MFQVKPVILVAALAFCGAADLATAKPLPIASQEEADAFVERVDLRRCYWMEGHLLCTPYIEAAEADSGRDGFGYYAAPGIYVGTVNPAAFTNSRDTRTLGGN